MSNFIQSPSMKKAVTRLMAIPISSLVVMALSAITFTGCDMDINTIKEDDTEVSLYQHDNNTPQEEENIDEDFSMETIENGTIFTVKGVTFTMINVQGGTFLMGLPYEEYQDKYYDMQCPPFPVHNVTLSDYQIAQCEVTDELWYAVMEGYVLPGSCPALDGFYEWLEFIEKLNQYTGLQFRMPTEAEWEYAARGGIYSQGYKYAGSDDISEVAWYEDNSDNNRHDVALKAPNELGLYDMTGNAEEWCSDYAGRYPEYDLVNPAGPEYDGDPTSYTHIIRGGGFYDNDEYTTGFRSSFNNNYSAGLRLVLPASSETLQYYKPPIEY